jgi:hypothetical protein
MLQKEVGSQGFDMYPYITLCALDILCGECLNKTVQSKLFFNFVGSYRQAVNDIVLLIVHHSTWWD